MGQDQLLRELIEAETVVDLAVELVTKYQMRLQKIKRRIAREKSPIRVGMRVRHPDSGQVYMIGGAVAVNNFGKLGFRYWGRSVNRSPEDDDGPLTWLENHPEPQGLIVKTRQTMEQE